MTDTSAPQSDLDAIVIGAGFAGIYTLHKLRNELGLRTRAFDAAGGVGGTWYWNRYPGATSDSEGFVYRYSWDKEMLQEWDWDTRYVSQAHTLSYLEAVVAKYDLAKDIQLETRISGAEFDDATGRWTVTTAAGETFTARYLVTGLGPLSTTYTPEIKGRESFRGRIVHTADWPSDLSLEGKRVGVIGTGSTGTGFICAAAKTAGHLTVFQRTPQYNVPSGNGPVSAEYVADIRARYDAIWEQARNSFAAAGFEESRISAMSVSAEERQAAFQKAWDEGNGFRFMFGAFYDVALDPAANEAAAEFIRGKIREIVQDPETARLLTPTDLYAKRPIANPDYYETFNRDNVRLVSVRETPIREFSPNGLVTEDGTEHELDVLVFATGFDAVDGSYRQLNPRGRGGESIQDHWADRPTSYLGMAVNGFPNMFMIYGPNSTFSNIPPCIEIQVEWVTDLVRTAQERGAVAVEATGKAEEEWVEICQQTADHTLFPKADSYFFGANIPGKKRRNMFFFGGIAAYVQKLREVTDDDYAGFVVRGPGETAGS
ncbi:flavin-containing monooxygenase [Streptomyces sp. NPDC021020]|uniref:flavin-containing monooxygenase n=1 Tax=Streptomyces sp. NPDC021020 TaxID=3365109 RepID=UPI003790E817